MSEFQIELGGATIVGESEGFGLPVVFLHAGVCDRRQWETQMEEVAAAGYHVIAYDRRGFGETHSPDEPFDHLTDLEALLDQLSVHAVILVGCSMGGGLAVDFALANPERTIGLVLSGTAITGYDAEDEVPDEALPVIHAYEDALEAEDWDTINKIEAHLWLDGPGSQSGRVSGYARNLFLEMNGDRLAKPKLTQEEELDAAVHSLSQITAPTLLVVGDLDFENIIELHEELSETLESSFATVIEDTAHLPNLERPDLFNPLLLEFLDAIAGREDLGEDDEEGDDDEDFEDDDLDEDEGDKR